MKFADVVSNKHASPIRQTTYLRDLLGYEMRECACIISKRYRMLKDGCISVDNLMNNDE